MEQEAELPEELAQFPEEPSYYANNKGKGEGEILSFTAKVSFPEAGTLYSLPSVFPSSTLLTSTFSLPSGELIRSL